MQNFDKQIVNELMRVCSAEEVLLVLLGEASDEVRSKVQTVARVLTDEWNDTGWSPQSANVDKLKDIFNVK